MPILETKTIISEAGPEDLDGIISLLSQLSPPGPGERLTQKTGREILSRIIKSPDYYLCVAKAGGEAAGTATLLLQSNLSHGGRPYGHVENVVTDFRFRHNGIGAAMVNFLVSRAKERGCYKVILNCEAGKIPFYERCGFRETSEVEMRLDP